MKQTTTTPKISVHLIDAADEIIHAFKTPDQFFTYLTDALTSVHNWELVNPNRKDQEDPHWALMRLLRDVYPAWEGKDPNKKMAVGFAEIADGFGNSFGEIIPGLMCAYAYELGNVGTPPRDVSKRDLDGIKALTEVGHYLRDHCERSGIDAQENKKAAA